MLSDSTWYDHLEILQFFPHSGFTLQLELRTDNAASPGLTGLIVSQDPGNADTPRAHITNMAALGRRTPWSHSSYWLGIWSGD